MYQAIFKKYGICRPTTSRSSTTLPRPAYMDKPRGRRLLMISSSGGAAISASTSRKVRPRGPFPTEELKAASGRFSRRTAASRTPSTSRRCHYGPQLYSKTIAEAKSDYDTKRRHLRRPRPRRIGHRDGRGRAYRLLRGAEVEREEASRCRKGIPVYPTPERACGSGAVLCIRRGNAAQVETHKKDETHDEGAETPSHARPRGGARAPIVPDPAVTSAPAKNAAEAVKLARGLRGPWPSRSHRPTSPTRRTWGAWRWASCPPGPEGLEAMMATRRQKAAGARIDGVTLSPMAKPGGVEVILGVIRDPQYGPSMMFVSRDLHGDIQGRAVLPASGRTRRVREDDPGYQGLPDSGRHPRKGPEGHRGPHRRDAEASRLVEDYPGLTRSISTRLSFTRRASPWWTTGSCTSRAGHMPLVTPSPLRGRGRVRG